MTACGAKSETTFSAASIYGSEIVARKIFKTTCAIVAAAGCILLLGTAGSSDCGLLTMQQILVRCSIGVAMVGGGLWMGGYIS